MVLHHNLLLNKQSYIAKKVYGYYAREELRIVLSFQELFEKTQFLFEGKPLWRYGIIGRENVRKFAVKQFYGRK